MKPAIRLFVSSTFLDMQEERYILNQEVFPIIKKKCADYGVSFYIVDLRWGITEEDQRNDDVISICLKEIKNCIPFFLGLIGNRYGWIPAKYDTKIINEFPWIKDYQGKSVTELEMISGAILNPDKDKTFFLFKDASLTDERHSDNKDELINDLKNQICEEQLFHKTYTSLEEFKTIITNHLLEVLDNYLIINKPIHFIRQEYFIDQIEEKYVVSPLEEKVREIIQIIKDKHQTFVIYGEKNRGVTTTFTHVINSLEGDKIIINLEADENFKYSFIDSLYIQLFTILNDLNLCDFSLSQDDDTEGMRNQKRIVIMKNMKRWLSSIKTNKPLYILINDISYIYNTDNEMYYLDFFPDDLPDNVHIILTTSDYDQAFNALSYPIITILRNMGIGKDFFTSYLSFYGKKMDNEIMKEYDNFSPEDLSIYQIIADFTINYTNFDSYKNVLYRFSKTKTIIETYKLAYDILLDDLNDHLKIFFKFILLKLYYARYGLTEDELFNNLHLSCKLIKSIPSNNKITGIYELTGIDKSYLSRIVKFFCNLKGDRFQLSDEAVTFIQNYENQLMNDLIDYQKEIIIKLIEEYHSQIKVYDYLTSNGSYMNKETLLIAFANNEEIRMELTDDLSGNMLKNNVLSIIDYFNNMSLDELYENMFNNVNLSFNRNIIGEVNQVYTLFIRNPNIDSFGKLFQNTFLMAYLYANKRSLLFRILITFCIQVHNQKGYDDSVEVYTTKYYLSGLFDQVNFTNFLEQEYIFIVGDALRIVSVFGYDEYLRDEFNIEFYPLSTLDYYLLTYDYSYESYQLYTKYLDDISVDLPHDEYLALLMNDLKELIEIYNSDEQKPIIYWFTVLDLICIIGLENEELFNPQIASYITNMKEMVTYLQNPCLLAEYDYQLGYFWYRSNDLEKAKKYLTSAYNAAYSLGEIAMYRRIFNLLKNIDK